MASRGHALTSCKIRQRRQRAVCDISLFETSGHIAYRLFSQLIIFLFFFSGVPNEGVLPCRWYVARACGHWPSPGWVDPGVDWPYIINRPQPGGTRASTRSPVCTFLLSVYVHYVFLLWAASYDGLMPSLAACHCYNWCICYVYLLRK